MSDQQYNRLNRHLDKLYDLWLLYINDDDVELRISILISNIQHKLGDYSTELTI